jgi:hypothetical protein
MVTETKQISIRSNPAKGFSQSQQLLKRGNVSQPARSLNRNRQCGIEQVEKCSLVIDGSSGA